ncbi:MAG: acyl carrier protein [Acidimicrobiales bacterium]
MTVIDAQVSADVLELVNELAGDWEYDQAVTADTRFLGDLGLESLDLVVIGTMVQQKYGKLPFSEWLAEIGQRPIDQRDVTVGDLVSYICANRPGNGAG